MSKEKIKRLYKCEKGRWLLAFLITILFSVGAGVLCPKVFFINDDENIMYTLAGYYTGGIPFDHSFINYILGGVIRLLYTFFPGVPWYGVFHVFVLFFSLVIINKTFLKESLYKGITVIISVCINLVLFCSVFLYPTVLMQFTTTSACAGVAAIALLLSINFEKDSFIAKRVDAVICILLVVLCFMIRKNTGYVILCFFFGTVLYQCVKILFSGKDKQIIKKRFLKFIIWLGNVILLLILTVGISSIKRSTDRWEYFYEYDSARYKMTDYPHDSFDENPELFARIGWGRELYELAGKSWWFFMDSRINAESFNEISQTGYYDQETTTIAEMWQCAKGLFDEDIIAQIALLLSVICIVCGCVFVFTAENKKIYLWEYLYGLAIVFGTVILCVYLCYKQRFPLRAFHTIILPFLLIINILLLRITPVGKIKSNKNDLIKKRTVIVMILISVLTGGLTINTARQQAYSRIEKSNRTLLVEQYAIEHPESFFVYDTSLTFRYLPFVTYEEKYPSNLTFWGGMGWKSPAFFKQMEINDLDFQYSHVLFEDNVYYVTWNGYVANDITMKDLLQNYMTALYPSSQFELVDTIQGDICVYKFVQ